MRTTKSEKPVTISRKKNDQSFFNGQNTAFFRSSEEGVQTKSFFLQGKSHSSRAMTALPVQTKIKIGKPNDKYEQEADLVADNVVRKIQRSPRHEFDSGASGNNAPTINRFGEKGVQEEELQRKQEQLNFKQSGLQKKPIFESNEDPVEEQAVQRKTSGEAAYAEAGLAQQLNQSKGRGEPLRPGIQNKMESNIGADFNKVRIHTDSNAVQMSQELNAKAFTHGSDIYFNQGQYNAGESSGQHLLAHELTHTVQQGASQKIARKSNTSASTTQVSIQRGWLGDAANWVKEKIQNGLNWAAERVIPGYTLLNVILGKNLITDKAVARSGVNLIEGFLDLTPVIGKILFNELKETKSLTKAGIWVEKQIKRFGINFSDIATKLKSMWDDMSVWRGMDYNVGVFKRYFGSLIGRIVAFAVVVAEKVKELRFKGALLLVGATKLVEAIEKDPKALKRMIDNPKLILKNFMLAIKKGFTQFKDKFFFHFKNALLGWLFGKSAELGVQMPKKFDIPGLFHLIAQLMGITYPQIRAMVVKEIGPKGEMIVSKMEASVEFVRDLITRGPIALWDRVKDFLSNLKEMFFSAITKLVLGEIVKVAVVKLVSMLNPAGAIVQLVLTLYRVIKFFIDWWQTIKDVASGIINSITMVALGKLKGAANFVEGLLAKGMKLVIAFLANIFGLGGIVKKVRDLILRISKPVRDAIRKVIAWIVKKGKSLFGKLIKGGKAKIKSAVKKITNWWKMRHSFKDKAGKDHKIYFKGQGSGAELMIASTPRLAHKLVNDILKTTDGKKVAKQIRTVLNRIYKLKLKINTFSPKQKLKTQQAIDEIELKVAELGKLFAKVSLSGKKKKMSKVTLQFNDIYTGFELKHYIRQLNEQETAINGMTIAKWLSNRYAFEKKGRIPDATLRGQKLAGMNQASLAKNNQNKKYKAFEAEQKKKGLTKTEIDEMWDYKMAATHRLDQVAGGDHHDFSYIGVHSINSAIGSQWRSGGKIKKLVKAAEDVDPAVYEKEKMKVALEIK